MASAFDKQHSSRPNVSQILAYLGGGATVASTIFGVATQQLPNSEIRFPSYYGDVKFVTNWSVGTSSDFNTNSNAALLYIGSYSTPQDPRKVGLGLTTNSYVSED